MALLAIAAHPTPTQSSWSKHLKAPYLFASLVSCNIFDFIKKQEELVNKIIEEHVKLMNKMLEQAMREFEDAVRRSRGIYDGYFLTIRIENGKPYVRYYRFSSKPFGEELKREEKEVAKVATQA